MKILVIMFFAVSLMTTAQAQKVSSTDVPSAVAAAFKSKFPAVTKVKWEMEDANEYEAIFKQDGEEASANFDQTGKWLETELEIEVSGLPANILAALKKDFAGYKINEASKVESVKNGSTYEAEVEKGEMNYDVLYAADGKFISKTKVAEGKEGKD